MREVADTFLGSLALGDVGVGADDATIDQGHAADLDDHAAGTFAFVGLRHREQAARLNSPAETGVSDGEFVFASLMVEHILE